MGEPFLDESRRDITENEVDSRISCEPNSLARFSDDLSDRNIIDMGTCKRPKITGDMQYHSNYYAFGDRTPNETNGTLHTFTDTEARNMVLPTLRTLLQNEEMRGILRDSGENQADDCTVSSGLYENTADMSNDLYPRQHLPNSFERMKANYNADFLHLSSSSDSMNTITSPRSCSRSPLRDQRNDDADIYGTDAPDNRELSNPYENEDTQTSVIRRYGDLHLTEIHQIVNETVVPPLDGKDAILHVPKTCEHSHINHVDSSRVYQGNESSIIDVNTAQLTAMTQSRVHAFEMESTRDTFEEVINGNHLTTGDTVTHSNSGFSVPESENLSKNQTIACGDIPNIPIEHTTNSTNIVDGMNITPAEVDQTSFNPPDETTCMRTDWNMSNLPCLPSSNGQHSTHSGNELEYLGTTQHYQLPRRSHSSQLIVTKRIKPHGPPLHRTSPGFSRSTSGTGITHAVNNTNQNDASSQIYPGSERKVGVTQSNTRDGRIQTTPNSQQSIQHTNYQPRAGWQVGSNFHNGNRHSSTLPIRNGPAVQPTFNRTVYSQASGYKRRPMVSATGYDRNVCVGLSSQRRRCTLPNLSRGHSGSLGYTSLSNRDGPTTNSGSDGPNTLSTPNSSGPTRPRLPLTTHCSPVANGKASGQLGDVNNNNDDNNTQPPSAFTAQPSAIVPSPYQVFPDQSTRFHARVSLIQQPELQHRARYQTEGSRGAIKDRTASGFPTVQLTGWNGKAYFQVFVGTENGRPRPHPYYQAYLVTGKQTRHTVQAIRDGVNVIEMPYSATNDGRLSVENVGILKLRKSDVEQRIHHSNNSTRSRMSDVSGRTGVTGPCNATSITARIANRKSGKARLIFRVLLWHERSASYDVIQTVSEPILCTQLVGDPELTRVSLCECDPQGGWDLFILGKNLGRECHVLFRQLSTTSEPGSEINAPIKVEDCNVDTDRSPDRSSDLTRSGFSEVLWQREAEIEVEFTHQTHLVCRVPAYDGPCLPLRGPLKVQLIIRFGQRWSNPFPFVYNPREFDTF